MVVNLYTSTFIRIQKRFEFCNLFYPDLGMEVWNSQTLSCPSSKTELVTYLLNYSKTEIELRKFWLLLLLVNMDDTHDRSHSHSLSLSHTKNKNKLTLASHLVEKALPGLWIRQIVAALLVPLFLFCLFFIWYSRGVRQWKQGLCVY